MTTLTRELRRSLENTVREARRTAEAGARKVIEQLAVHHHEPWPSMTPAQRDLRNRLRAHGRQLGDRRDEQRGLQAIDRLTSECAYEHWHRLLFARFLAETELLIEPLSGIAITLAECEELARNAGRDWLEVAAEFAQRMLPQIFRNGDPVLEVALPPETRSAIEDLMKALPRDVFVADDSLGWVYQFWQADRKDEVNRSEKKIGADELPAVTQLFTEDYMVFFLLHNTLGAWWAGKVLGANPRLAASASNEDELRAACTVGDIEWAYLRFVREDGGPWRPAAGAFDGWPKVAKDITLLDPCMGSGHFLVFALPILAAMRAVEESLSPETAIEVVLRENLYGLEIDPRCTQIAAFNLALAAWRRVGYRQLPALHLACSGLSLGVTKAEWLRLAERAAQSLPLPPKTDLLGTDENLFSDAMKRGLERLYDLFARAPWLGSLIEPRSSGGDLIEEGFADLEPVLSHVMTKTGSVELTEMAVAAHGLEKAAATLAMRFTLVATNVPYLGRGKQHELLKDHCEREYPHAKADLATCFLLRTIALCAHGGTTALVAPQNWWFIKTYTAFRKSILSDQSFCAVATLGEEAWQSFGDRGPVAALTIMSNGRPLAEDSFVGLDALARSTIEEKVGELRAGEMLTLRQEDQFRNPDHRIAVAAPTKGRLLKDFAKSFQGIKTGDDEQATRGFWEMPSIASPWRAYQGSVSSDCLVGGLELVLSWGEAGGALARKQGLGAWDHAGVMVGLMRALPVTRYFGDPFASSVSPLIPNDVGHLPAIWCYCSSAKFREEVRKVDKRVCVTNGSLLNVPFDADRWQDAAIKAYPNGLPIPVSREPNQWIFEGNPSGSDVPLQVAVARLVGYRWPRQTGSAFLDCPALGLDALEQFADQDGIVTLSPVKGEQAAAARLTSLLAKAFGSEWTAARLSTFLSESGFAGKSLDDWLRDGFFDQHCELFGQRPFIWHVSDGRRDGFHALVNYHRLAAPDGEGRRTLEKLIYSYLGDWIDRQRADQKAGVEGADARVTAAEHLKAELINILVGEPPYDIFVRWKPLYQQPLGWEPDINDGVRMNIRPFMAAKPLGARARGACILRTTPKIKWDRDRGKEPRRPREDFPWFWNWDGQTSDFDGRGKEPDGNRWNDLHYTRAFKEAARARKAKG